MFGSGNSPSLADIAAVTDKNNDGNGFGNGMGGWWAIIILLAMFGGFGGWGHGGFGNNGGGSGETTIISVPSPNTCYGGGYGMGWGFEGAALQRGFDNSTVVSKLDGLANGICSLGYDQLAQMNQLGNTVTQTGWNLAQVVNAGTVEGMKNTYALSTQLSDCCCENRAATKDLQYNMAKDTCAITTAIKDAVAAITQNDNANYRSLHDEQVAIQMEALRERNREQASMIQALNLAQSQANQNNYFDQKLNALADRLDPCPKPSYWVQNPNCRQNPWEAALAQQALQNDRRCGSCCG